MLWGTRAGLDVLETRGTRCVWGVERASSIFDGREEKTSTTNERMLGEKSCGNRVTIFRCSTASFRGRGCMGCTNVGVQSY